MASVLTTIRVEPLTQGGIAPVVLCEVKSDITNIVLHRIPLRMALVSVFRTARESIAT